MHTPLSLAFFSGSDLSERENCMRLLIAGRADPFLPSSENWTLLDEAADKKGWLWKLLQSIPQGNRAITDTETAANWIVHRLRHRNEVDTEFAIAFLREVDEGAPSSVVSLPAKFEITEPASDTTFSRETDDITIAWDVTDGAPMRADITGDCFYVDDIEVDACGEFESQMYSYLDVHHKDMMAKLVEKGALDDEMKAEIKTALDAFKAEFQATHAAAAATE